MNNNENPRIEKLFNAAKNTKLTPEELQDEKENIAEIVELQHIGEQKQTSSENISLDTTNEKHITPLRIAIQNNNTDIAVALIQQGALIDKPAFYFAQAILKKNYEILAALIDRGILPEAVNDIAYRFYGGMIFRNQEFALKLINKIASTYADKPTFISEFLDSSFFGVSNTALMQAISHKNNPEIINRLISLGAPVNTQDKSQRTALIIACENDLNDSATLLIQAHDIDFKLSDKHKKTALDYAI